MKLKSHLLVPAVLLLLSVFSVSPLWGQNIFEEGLTLHKKTESSGMMGQGAQSQTSKMYLDGSTIRQVDSDGEEFIIFNQEQKFVTINHNKKTYSEVTFAELNKKIEEVSKQMSESSQENQQAMEMLKKMMGNQEGELTVERVGPAEEIAGFETVKYLVSVAPLKMEIWAAPELKVPDVYYDSMKIQATPNPIFEMEKMFEAFKQIEGLSLKTVVSMKMMGMQTTTTDEVIKVERGPVPDPQIPDGYKEVPLQF